MRRYLAFSCVTEAALRYACTGLGPDLSDVQSLLSVDEVRIFKPDHASAALGELAALLA